MVSGKLARRVAASLRYRAGTARLLLSRLGPSGVLTYGAHRAVSYPRLRARGAAYPVRVRRGTSDIEVFHQIFVEREYACLDDIVAADLIVDCGANAGYSSAYFLTRFPDADLFAIEPDAANFALLEDNLRPYGPRARAIRAGVWSERVPLVVEANPYRDGREWSRQVRPAQRDEAADLEGISVAAILGESAHQRISILKMDIEGAEAVVFADDRLGWLDRVDAIVIELHDDSSFGSGSAAFRRAIRGRNFSVSIAGELTVCRRA